MEDNQYNDNSKTVFVRQTPTAAVTKYAAIILIVALILGGVIVWANITSGARAALSHARDIRVAMKLVSTEYFKGENSIYDPTAENGMQPNVLEKISSVCQVKGELILNSWDREKNIPLSFTYREGRYLVEYRDTGNGNGTYGMNGDWTVYCDVKVMEYTSGD